MNVVFALAVVLATWAAPEQPIQVSFCELTSYPDRYHSQLVAVRARLDLDMWILYAPKCSDRDHWLDVDAWDLEKRIEARIRSVSRTLWQGVVEGEFIGRFRGPPGYDYRGARAQIRFLDVLELRRVRWPERPDRAGPARWLELYKAVEMLDRRWFEAIHLDRDTDVLREIFSEDYVAIFPSGDVLAGPQAAVALDLPHWKTSKAGEAEGIAPTFEIGFSVFAIDLQTAVSIWRIKMLEAPAEWGYVNIIRKTGSQWRFAFSRFILEDGHQEPQAAHLLELRCVQRPELPDHVAAAARRQLRETIEAMGRRWLAAAHGQDADELNEILSEDYVPILPNGERLPGRRVVDTLDLPHQNILKARVAAGAPADTLETRVWVFPIDLETAVSIWNVSLGGAGEDAPAEWEYVNIYRKTGSNGAFPSLGSLV